ncbi:MAG: diaminobutyrate acetyltransferase [Acidimicrobiia bacterium]|nr:diaminobutyrate acetyltransferase [Acidimicrobiia bacterium]
MATDHLLRHPTPAEGGVLWTLAGAAGGLDRNTPYAYLLWCRDFAASTVVAESDGAVVGFITGYRRPAAPDTLFVWQVAVHPGARRRGLAMAMLEWLTDHSEGAHWVEATVTPSNAPSAALFSGFARRHGAELLESELFAASDFPDCGAEAHEAEVLVRIGPLE